MFQTNYKTEFARICLVLWVYSAIHVNMKGKPTSSTEQVIIYNLFKYFKAHKPSGSQQSLLKHTTEATGSSLSTVRRIAKQKRWS